MRLIFAWLLLSLGFALVAPAPAAASSSPSAETPHDVGRPTPEASPTPPAVAARPSTSGETQIPEAPTTADLIGAMLGAQATLADVGESNVHLANIQALAKMGVFDGTLCSTGFCPNDPIDRKTVAVWLVRVLEGADPPARSSRFFDVAGSPWWEAHVERLAELGITFGCGTNPLRFCPTQDLTRAQTAAFLVRAFNLEPGPDFAFADVTPTQTHYTSINSLAASRITVGCGDGTKFCPKDHTTRAQMATLLHRAITSQYIDPTTKRPNAELILTESYIRWPDLLDESPYLELMLPDDLKHEFVKWTIPYRFELPTILEDLNNKRSILHSAVNSSSWQGRHEYACGVSGEYSTKAEYDFGTIDRQGTYEIYAYFPGYTESHWSNNEGFGRYTTYIDGTITQEWEESRQYGGWQRILFGEWGWGKYEGRISTATQELEVGDRLVIEIHNGGHKDEGDCAPNTTVVFPPMLLVRVEDVKDLRPFSPAHDLHPWTALLFNACMKMPKEVDLWLESGDLLEQLSGLDFGVGGLNKLDNHREQVARIFHCELIWFEECESFLYFGYWTPPNTTLNHSNVSLEPEYLTCLSRLPGEGPEMDLSDGVLWLKWR